MPFDGAQFYTSPVRVRKPWYRPLRSLVALSSQDAPVLRLVPAEPDIGVIQLLETAKRMIEDPYKWVQRSYATLDGRHCAVGALRAAARQLNASSTLYSAHVLLLAVARQRGFRKVEGMNDESTHGEVLTAFDEAIAAASHRMWVAA